MTRHDVPRNLPHVATSLVGRRRELQRILETLADPETRLLTLIGPGGVGKTRLAIEVARRADDDDFPHGVTFVELAAVGDADLLTTTIAASFGLPTDDSRPAEKRLREYLQERDLLLVLDNLEQLLRDDRSAQLIASLIAGTEAGRLAILATSRERLRIRGERTFEVLPFSTLPRSGNSEQHTDASDAVRFFELHARAVRADFTITEQNSQAVLDVCRRVDGLPLGIELAAARVAHFTPEELLARMERRLPILIGGPRDAPDRLRTMRQAIGWSYDLLSPEEQTRFRAVSVFPGDFSAEMAETVALGSSVQERLPIDASLGSHDAVERFHEVLASLIDQSLLRRVDGHGDQTRYAMLDTIREFGLDQLSECGEEEQTRWSYVAAYVTLTERIQIELFGAEPAGWLDLLEREHDNIRAAIGWALDHDGIESALRICTAIWLFWKQRGHLRDAVLWLRRGIEKSEGEVTIQRANTFLLLGHSEVDLARSADYYGHSLELYRQLGDLRSSGGALSSLGMAAFLSGDFSRAQSFHEESLNIFRQLGVETDIAQAHYQLGRAASGTSDYRTARRHLEEARGIWQQAGDVGGVAYTLLELSRVAQRERRLSEAEELLRWSLVATREAGLKDSTAVILSQLGYVALQRGDAPAAAKHFHDALEIFIGLGQRTADVVAAIEGIAKLALVRRQHELAVRLWAATSAWRDRTDRRASTTELVAYERDLSTARSALEPEIYEREWTVGTLDFDLERTIETAIEWTEKVLDGASGSAAAARQLDRIRTLTPQERRVLCCVVRRLTNQQIADFFSVRLRTVTTHMDRIFTKLDVDNRTAAAAQAIAANLCGS
jgi:predicted ATPase/DNA-binding CsgD family transcriptional regulator